MKSRDSSDAAWMYPIAGVILVYGALSMVFGAAVLVAADHAALPTSNPLELGSRVLWKGANVTAVAPRASVLAFWLVVAVSALTLGISALTIVRLKGRGQQLSSAAGYASWRQTRDLVGHRRQQKASATEPERCIHLGRDVRSHKLLTAPAEDSVVVVGPSRSGKTSRFVAPNVMQWPGPAVVTSTRPDVLDTTAEARPGPVCVYDPTNLLENDPRSVGFDPLQGCNDQRVARMRTLTLANTAEIGSGVSNAGFWRDTCAACLRVLFLAGALGGQTIADVRRWIAGMDIRPAQAIFDQHPGAVPPDWRDELTRHMTSPEKTRIAICQQMLTALGALVDPEVMRISCPQTTGIPAFDAERFLAERGTVYILGTATEQAAIAPLISTFVENIVLHARRRAAALPGRRLSPPLGLFLDEAANIAPLPTLPGLLSDGGSVGISTLAIFQSLHQARARWGRDAAEAMIDAAAVTLILGGLRSPDDLAAWSRLLGEVDEQVRTVSRGSGGGGETLTPRTRPMMTVAQIRTLTQFHALLLYRGKPPIRVVLELPADSHQFRRSN